MRSTTAGRRRNWTRDETLLALLLVLRLPYAGLSKANPEVGRAARVIGRTPAALAMKALNLFACLPGDVRGGLRALSHASGLDREIVREWMADPDRVLLEAADRHPFVLVGHDAGPARSAGRIHRGLLRARLLDACGRRCCVTGHGCEELLVACHIKPWELATPGERAGWGNGLLLNALHARAFDRGLVTVTEGHVTRLSPALVVPDPAFRAIFEGHAGRPIALPRNVSERPSPALLRWHTENVFRGSAP